MPRPEKRNPDTAPSQQNEDAACLAHKHLSCIAQRCLSYWKCLPTHVKSSYDLDDMISDVVMHVWKVQARYDPKKSKEVTWVYWVADRKCQTITARFRVQKRTMEMVEGDALTGDSQKSTVLDRYAAPNSSEELRAAKDAVEHVIEFGSDATRDFLDRLFNGKPVKTVPAYELRATAKACGATYRDFQLVYRGVVA